MGAVAGKQCVTAQGELAPDVSLVLFETEELSSPLPKVQAKGWGHCLRLQDDRDSPDAYLILNEQESEIDKARRLAREEAEAAEAKRQAEEAEVKRKAEEAQAKAKAAEAAAEADREEERRMSQIMDANAESAAAVMEKLRQDKDKKVKKPKKVRLTDMEEDDKKAPSVYFVFDKQPGLQPICITSMPLGFTFGFPWLDVRRVQAASEAGQQGVKNGWLLRQWGTDLSQLESISDENRDNFRSELVRLSKEMPRVEITAAEQLSSPESSEEGGSNKDADERASQTPSEVAVDDLEPELKDVQYDLNITIKGAKELRDADWMPGGGGSDPYCICKIEGRGSGEFKTKTVSDSQNPKWDETALLTGFYVGDSLVFTVYDEDYGKSDDLLGVAKMNTRRVVENFKGNLLLRTKTTPGKAPTAGKLSVKVMAKMVETGDSLLPDAAEVDGDAPNHRIAQSFVAEFKAMELEIAIHSARGLRDADWAPGGGTSDPYCMCEVKGKGRTKIKTKTIDNNVNPKWNFTGAIPDFHLGDELLFAVYDYDWGSADDLLGRITVPTDKIVPFGFKGDLRLKDTHPDRKQEGAAYLSVQIKIKRRF